MSTSKPHYGYEINLSEAGKLFSNGQCMHIVAGKMSVLISVFEGEQTITDPSKLVVGCH